MKRGEGGGWVDWLERRINLSEIFSFLTHFGVVYTPVETHRPLAEVVRDVSAQKVPAYARWPRILGLFAAILFGLQVITGVLLAYYYRPTPEAAYESTRTIVRDLSAGWFIHYMHAWGAWLLIGVVTLRLLRLFWDGLYRAPRELLWWSAVAMAAIVLKADFTGRLLTWESGTYWGTVRGMEVGFAIPIVGPLLAFLVGGRVVNEDVLIRFYVFHLLVLPVAFVVLLYFTFATLRRVGLSTETGPVPPRTTTFRDHVYTMAILTVLLFAVQVTLATLLSFPFERIADPYVTPAGARPPLYLLAPYALIHGAPGPPWLAGLVLVAIGVAVLLLPLWRRDQRPEERRLTRLAGAVALLLWVALSIGGALLDRRGP